MDFEEGRIICPCKKDLPGELFVSCDECEKWFHGTCATLSNEEVETLISNAEKWFCVSCSKQAQPLSASQSAVQTANNVTCPRCTASQKIFKGKRGLRIHYARLHKDFISDLEGVNGEISLDNVQSLMSTLAHSKKNVKVLKRIPKGARMMAAHKLTLLMDNCLSNSLESWISLLMFSYAALQVPENSKNLTQAVKNNVSRSENPGSSSLPPRYHSSKDSKGKRGLLAADSTSLSRRVESKIAEGDVRGAVKILSSSDSLAEESDEVYTKLKAKHPSPSRVLCFPDPPTLSECGLVVSEKQVQEAILSFPNGSSGGIDGLRPQHLKDLVSKSNGDVGSKLLSALTRLCNLLLSGNVNSDITQVLYGATVCALNKKQGGIRPIAVGCTLRRLVSKLGCRAVRDEMSSYLNPIQLGFGTRGGCEGAIHATRTYINQNKATKKVVLKIDFENAFNMVERDTLLTQVKEKTPHLYPFLWQCYANPTVLFFGNKIIQSQVGLQQGDPAGPLGFSLAIHPIIQQITSDLNAWYLDDGTIAGDPKSVLRDFKTVVSKCKDIGLCINPEKCELFFCKDVLSDVVETFTEVSPGIQVVPFLSLLGSPISSECTKDVFKKKFEEITTLLDRLPGLKCHIAYYILKNCLSIPKLTYLLRTSPAWKVSQEIEDMDSRIKSTVEKIVNTKLNNETWRKCSLPVKFGGIGIRKISEAILPAFLSSVNSVFPLVRTMLNYITDLDEISEYAEGLEKWNERFGDGSIPTCTVSQHEWDGRLCNHVLRDLTLHSDEDRALHLASMCKESNGWLKVLPSRTVGTLLDNNTFRISMALRLGAPICAPHSCVCGEHVNNRGTHGLSCAKSAGRFSRHSCLNDILRRALASAKVPAVLEPVGVLREDGRRPDGMSLIPWICGKCVVWDATCTDTLAPCNIKSASKVAGSVGELAATKKKNKYKTLIEEYLFVPIAVETMGPWCSEAKKFVKDVGQMMAEMTGETRAVAFLRQRISIAIQRGNAASVMGTLPHSMDMSEIFYL